MKSLPIDAMLAQCMLSSCVYLCLSVTRQSSIKTAKPRITQTTPRNTLCLKKRPIFELSVTCQIITDFQNFCIAGKHMKFATKPI